MSWRRSLSAIALLLALILASACATTVAKKAATPTAFPTATPVLTPPPLTIKPARPLTWTVHQLPFTVPVGESYSTDVAFSQADSATAYACAASAQGIRVWVTRDRADHWTAGAEIPEVATGCDMTIDDAHPETAILRSWRGDISTVLNNYLTRDAGASWSLLAVPSPDTPFYRQLRTQQGVTYAAAATPPHSRCDCFSALYMSKDGMRTWSRIDAGIQAAGRSSYVYWFNDGGDILAGTTNHYSGQDELWLTSDQGAHWKPWSAMQADYFLVPQGQGQRFWRACAVYSSASSLDPPNLPGLVCTLDGGATWTPSGGVRGTSVKLEAPAGIMTTDGAALRVVNASSPNQLQRATPGRQGWEPLGALPASEDEPDYGANLTMWANLTMSQAQRLAFYGC